MGAEMLAYPFLFISIFFEIFVLVTFLSRPAREQRGRKPAELTDALPTVAVIVPCLNEAETVGATAESLLALTYPKDRLEIILVDNGSTDATPEIMERYAHHANVRLLSVPERGKHHAINAGIAVTNAELIGCLDADSFVDPEALRQIVRSFEHPRVGATTAAMSVHKPSNLLQHMQNAEYIFGIMLRHALSTVNGIYVTPGPFSFYRRSIVVELGGFRHGYQTEDLEMALRLQQAGYWIDNAPHARVYTKAPRTILSLIRQRTRWTSGFMRNVLQDYRGMVGNRGFGALGTIVLPVAFIAIFSGILLFGIVVFKTLENALTFYRIHSGIPFTFPALTIDWFYFPATFYLLLGVAVTLVTLAFIVMGRRISRTRSNLFLGIISYTLLYGLMVPFWLMRATADVALNKNRTWR